MTYFNVVWIILLYSSIFEMKAVKSSRTYFYQSPTTLIDNQKHYEYRYTIEDPTTGVVSEKWESRLGDYVKGRYSFLQADGLVQTVHYESDGVLGYRAIVQITKPVNRVTFLPRLVATTTASTDDDADSGTMSECTD